MRYSRLIWIAVVCLLAACGKSPEKKASTAGASAPDTAAARGPSAISKVIQAKGFQVVEDQPAPNQQSGRLASVVVYHSSAGAPGGVIYVQRPVGGGPEEVLWHWYYADSEPDSVAFTEINGDGLWDMRVFMAGGKTLDLVQGEAFTLLGPPLPVPVALNGPSSSPDGLWKCFDGDSATVWSTPGKDAFVELPDPLRAPVSEVDVQLAGKERPDKIDLLADGKKVQTLDLADTDQMQRFSLDSTLENAASLRVQMNAKPGTTVEVRELRVR